MRGLVATNLKWGVEVQIYAPLVIIVSLIKTTNPWPSYFSRKSNRRKV